MTEEQKSGEPIVFPHFLHYTETKDVCVASAVYLTGDLPEKPRTRRFSLYEGGVLMKPCVLFSPIGRTDPLRNGADGPLLHILRHYPVRKAVLFLTHETYAVHRRDDRYVKLGRMVSPDTEFEVCGDEDLVNAHTFEIFDAPFRAALERLHRENPRCELLVNITSGTPQMEASLYLLKAILPFPIRAIQVSTPANSSNESIHLSKDEALDEAALNALYSGLRDNAPDAPNRCAEVGGENAHAALLKKNILALVQSYDYAAALTLAESAPELFPEPFLQALRAAKHRLMLETLQAIPDLPGCFEEGRDGLREGYEYILMLDTLVQREAYGDYARAISPALVSLLVLALRYRTGLDVYGLCVRRTSGAEQCISPERVRSYDPQMFDYLQDSYRRSGFREGPLNADLMVKMLEYFRQRRGRNLDTRSFNRLRDFERKVRNCAAHQITPITEQQVLAWTGGAMSVAQAQDLLKKCFTQTSGKDYHWNGYEKVNRLLAERMDAAR